GAFAAIAAAACAAVGGVFGGYAEAEAGAGASHGGGSFAVGAGAGPESCGVDACCTALPPLARGGSRHSLGSKCGRSCIPYLADFHGAFSSRTIGITNVPVSHCFTKHCSLIAS